MRHHLVAAKGGVADDAALVHDQNHIGGGGNQFGRNVRIEVRKIQLRVLKTLRGKYCCCL